MGFVVLLVILGLLFFGGKVGVIVAFALIAVICAVGVMRADHPIDLLRKIERNTRRKG